VGKEVGPQ